MGAKFVFELALPEGLHAYPQPPPLTPIYNPPSLLYLEREDEFTSSLSILLMSYFYWHIYGIPVNIPREML